VEYQVYATLVAPTVRVYNGKKLQQDTVTDDFRTYMLQAIRQHFVPPSAPALSVYGFGISEDPKGASPVVFGQAVFSLTPTGGLANLQLVQSSLSSGIDESLMGALRRADSANAFPSPKDAGKAEITRLYVLLKSGTKVPSNGMLLFRMRVPVWHNVTYPTPDNARPIDTPRYPPGLLMLGFSGTFVMQFVIDEQGNVVPSTVALVSQDIKRSSTAPAGYELVQGQAQLGAFVEAVLPSLKGAHFVPATIDGCPVKSAAEMPFAFNLPR
jgi:hypothetical protein